MISLVKRRAFRLLLVFWIGSIFSSYAQRSWERIQDSKPNEITEQEKILRDLFQDANFNLGGADKPSPRSGAVFWQDADKNVWMFGGTGVGEDGNWGVFGDLWKFSLGSSTWTLQNGERNKTTDRLSKDQVPGARREAINWVDKQGVLWLMGGKLMNDNEFMSDIWTYDPKRQQWSNVKAKGPLNQNSNWGEKGKTSGNPGSRSGSATWTDKKGNLWFFGGLSQVYEEGRQNFYNDLWQFNPNSRSWKWVSGSNKPNQKSTYKDKGQEKVLFPGARVKALSWYEEGEDCLWLYGGEGVDSSGGDLGQLSDLWKFDIAADSWEWVGGSQGLFDKVGKGKSLVTTPGYRSSSITWKDNKGNFWLFGGQNKVAQTEADVDQMLWKYDVKSRKWSMVLTQGSPNIISDGCGFLSSAGDLMLFGGRKINFNNLKIYPTNEVWRINTK